jgi:hypothetical protein
VVDQFQSINLGFEYLLLLLALISSRSHPHHPASLSHRIHGALHVLLILVNRLHSLLISLVVQDQRLQLVQPENDQEIE